MKAVICAIICGAISYGCGAFVAADVDFRNWTSDGRFGTLMLMLFFVAVAYIIGIFDGAQMTNINYNDGNWHGWNGGECPVHPETEIDAMYDDGMRVSGKAGGKKYVGWTWEGNGSKVIAFRVVKEYREPQKPREWWIKPDSGVVCQIHKIGYIHVREVLE